MMQAPTRGRTGRDSQMVKQELSLVPLPRPATSLSSTPLCSSSQHPEHRSCSLATAQTVGCSRPSLYRRGTEAGRGRDRPALAASTLLGPGATRYSSFSLQSQTEGFLHVAFRLRGKTGPGAHKGCSGQESVQSTTRESSAMLIRRLYPNNQEDSAWHGSVSASSACPSIHSAVTKLGPLKVP